jgi:DNA mismatch endonuclease (patch repair protein)
VTDAAARRSAVMRAVKGRDTSPERAVRRLLRPIATGYRLNRRDLPGSPDIAYGRRRLAIFVHGCFWHGHGCKRGSRKPKTNAAYWSTKIARNQERDTQAVEALHALGWRTMVIWECEIKDETALSGRLRAFLDSSP